MHFIFIFLIERDYWYSYWIAFCLQQNIEELMRMFLFIESEIFEYVMVYMLLKVVCISVHYWWAWKPKGKNSKTLWYFYQLTAEMVRSSPAGVLWLSTHSGIKKRLWLKTRTTPSKMSLIFLSLFNWFFLSLFLFFSFWFYPPFYLLEISPLLCLLNR